MTDASWQGVVRCLSQCSRNCCGVSSTAMIVSVMDLCAMLCYGAIDDIFNNKPHTYILHL